jgi:hypothetical protein
VIADVQVATRSRNVELLQNAVGCGLRSLGRIRSAEVAVHRGTDMWTWLHHRLHGGGRSCRIIVQPIPESGRWHWSAVRLGTCLELGVGAVSGVNWTEVFLCGNVQPSADSASSTRTELSTSKFAATASPRHEMLQFYSSVPKISLLGRIEDIIGTLVTN